MGVALPAVVLAVALAIGSGVGSGGRPTDAQRAAALDTQIRCPSCEDLSIAQSSAPEAVAVRRQVAKLVRAGRSDAQIEQVLVGEWGPTILLRPPDHGLTAVIWIAPVVLAVGALGGVGVLFWRRSHAMARLREGSP
jgi:cytochrome c-type biogenesis protein CcmH